HERHEPVPPLRRHMLERATKQVDIAFNPRALSGPKTNPPPLSKRQKLVVYRSERFFVARPTIFYALCLTKLRLYSERPLTITQTNGPAYLSNGPINGLKFMQGYCISKAVGSILRQLVSNLH